MALLFAVSTDNVGLHIKNIIAENELDDSTTEESSVVQIEGNRKVTRKIKIWKYMIKLLTQLVIHHL